jgi:acyl-CoA thioesterase FadM
VSNQVYIRWLEYLRFEVIKRHFGWENFPKGVVPLLLRTEIDYLKALRLFDRVEGRMWISSFDNVKWTMEGEFLKLPSKELVVRAKHVGVFYNFLASRPTRIPRRLREALMGWKG